MLCFFVLLCICSLVGACKSADSSHISFSKSADSIDAYDFLEVAASISWPHARNPFVDARLGGYFETADGRKRWQVDGFCDSEDGSVFRVRFMPPSAGDYKYVVEYRQNGASKISTGTFHANDERRRGPI